MTLLDELLAMPPTSRRLRLGRGETRDAILALGTAAGVAWLEEHLESPIFEEYGSLLYSLKPEWSHLDRWIRLSKLHCLAAVDALKCFTHLTFFEEPELPTGANPTAINEALDYALDHYGNPRLQDAASTIRHVWPVSALEELPEADRPKTGPSMDSLIFRLHPCEGDARHSPEQVVVRLDAVFDHVIADRDEAQRMGAEVVSTFRELLRRWIDGSTRLGGIERLWRDAVVLRVSDDSDQMAPFKIVVFPTEDKLQFHFAEETPIQKKTLLFGEGRQCTEV